MAQYYFAIGTTLATLQNVENLISQAPHVLGDERIKLMGPIRRVTLDQKTQRNGAVTGVLQWGVDVLLSDIDTLITNFWGDYLTTNASLYISWLDESGHYSPFYCEAERPEEGSHFQNFNGYKAQNLAIPIRGVVRQDNTEDSTTTITTSQRYVESDTTGGTVTLTLPAANAVNADTVFSFVKTGGANALTLDGDGSQEIDGSTTKVVTGRVNIVSNGVDAWRSV